MKCKRTWIVPVVWLAVLACMVVCFGAGAVNAPGQGYSAEYQRLMSTKDPREAGIIRRSLKIDFHEVDAGMQARERVDFMLTPALLVQEAISDGVILTYHVE